jgi:DNA-binding NtrC family response regulator
MPETVSIHRPSEIAIRRAALQVVAGPDAGKRVEIDGVARVGARTLADIVLTDPKVSGLHCEVHVADTIRLRDLGSKNGTFVGGVRIVEVFLGPNDVIAVGDSRLQVVPLGARSEPLHDQDDFHGLVGASPAMRGLTARLAQLAQNDTTVLIQGETGTGKERVAEALHLASRRAPQPQVVVDCGAMPATMIEAELFGHERGAFTGAVASVPGAFERAQGGTLFLDEIGELPLELQPKLLRAIESRVVRRLGGTRTLDVDVRVVSATNRDLALEVAAGRFREDLYYRLAVVTLKVPPLRDRLEDVPLLVGRIARDLGIDPAPFLEASTMEALQRHGWPGNVRELRNTIERAAALSEPVYPAGDKPPPDSALAAPESVDVSVPLRMGRQRVIERYERAYIEKLLADCSGNVSEASRRAGLERMSMYRLLHRLKLR